MRHNIDLARRFVQGLSYERFRDDELYFYAVTRCLEFIFEASRRVWGTVEKRLPPLLAAVERELRDLGKSP